MELLLFTGIIAVMAGALVGFSLVSTNLSTRSEVTAEVEQNAAVVMQRIIYEVQNADIVAHPDAGQTADSLVLVRLDSNRRPVREVLIGLFRDRVRIIENQNQSSVAFLTTEDMGVSNLAFLHFSGPGTATGVSVVFRAFNKAAGAGVAANQYVRDFHGTAVLRPSRCSEDTDCPTSGDKCCGGACAVPVGVNCPACATSADCAAPACNLATCDYNVSKCVAGACTAVDMGPCTSCSRCGDGFKDEAAGEECDDGNNVNGDACTNECTSAVCGDGIIWDTGGGTEQCDDGNTASGDGCSATCQNENLCSGGGPNGVKTGDEECDDNGVGGNLDACDNNCRLTVCGDGVTQTSTNGQGINEQCDDGNTLAGDACSPTCQNVTAGECGNGIKDGTEACDDGKRCTVTGDPCNVTADCVGGGSCSGFSADGCTTPGGCVPSAEVCNDNLDNDCDSLIDCADTVNCTGQACAGGGVCLVGGTCCGNGVKEPPEQCDDGGTTSGNGCSATCQNESPCDNDGTCESGNGETSGNCALDCGACFAGQSCSRAGGIVTGCDCGACFYCVNSATNVIIGDGESGKCRAFADTVAGGLPNYVLNKCFENTCCTLYSPNTCSIGNNSTPGQSPGNCAVAEVCDNDIDDDLDGMTDCADTVNCPNGTACAGGGTCSGGNCTVTVSCCVNALPTSLTMTMNGHTGCSCANGTNVTMTWDPTANGGAGGWVYQGTVCGKLWNVVLYCPSGSSSATNFEIGSQAGDPACVGPTGPNTVGAQCSPLNLPFTGDGNGIGVSCCSESVDITIGQ